MQPPDSLYALVDDGIIDEVERPLMSGKEAQVYLVVAGGERRVAKVYKEAQDRTFRNRADYVEGRKVRNSRDQRAMAKGSRHGRAQNEAAWRSTEVDMIYRLRHAGVRVPTPFHFIDGVLIMELVCDAEGYPAPRLGDLTWEPEQASALFQRLLAEVVRMLCAGVVHGDLSDFNVLMASDGPVLIDFPQAVDASTNANARKLLLRDVANLHRFARKFAPQHVALPYGEEMWELYKRNALTEGVRLTGRYRGADRPASTDAVLGLIADASKDERRRRERLGLSLRGTDADGPRPGRRGDLRGPGRTSPSPSESTRRPQQNDGARPRPQQNESTRRPQQNDGARPRPQQNESTRPRPQQNGTGPRPQQNESTPRLQQNDGVGPRPQQNDGGGPRPQHSHSAPARPEQREGAASGRRRRRRRR